MRETIKTIGGVVIIGLIVIATFLYGNRQRQEQVRRDQATQHEQSQQAQEQTKTNGSSQSTPNVAVNNGNNPNSKGQISTNNSTSNSQSSKNTQPNQGSSSKSSQPANVGGGQLSNSGSQTTQTTPQTGSGDYLVPLAILSGLYFWQRRSRQVAAGSSLPKA